MLVDNNFYIPMKAEVSSYLLNSEIENVEKTELTSQKYLN